MSEMIERVARAIEDALTKEVAAIGGYMDSGGAQVVTVEASIDLSVIARAAIEAMRRPTEAMTDAGIEASVLEGAPHHTGAAAWDSMIDKALQ